MIYFDLQQERYHLWRNLAQTTSEPIFNVDSFSIALSRLFEIDRFWTYPGRGVLLRLEYYLLNGQFTLITQLVNNSCYMLEQGRYRQQTFSPFQTNLEQLDKPQLHEDNQLMSPSVILPKPYFEVLIIHPFPDDYEMLYRQQLSAFKSTHDEFIYDIVFVNCAEDALTAVLSNSDIQACVYLNHILASTVNSDFLFSQYSKALLAQTPPITFTDAVEINLCRSIKCVRPEIEHYLISELSPPEVSADIRQLFNRVLFHINPFHDLHAALLNGVRSRFATPFFQALQAYSRQPKGVFHALPLSRGASVKGSPWIHDMLDFYGDNIFLAETSSTQGGLDSLLDPTGAIKQAHIKAAETFAADASYFVTNGTSTSNKIVMQANLIPGDIVLISADCHKSIPYSVMLAGAYPIFLETYPLVEYDLYGGIDLAQIKAVMLELKQYNMLDKLKQITLTNSTFDGLIYHSENFMMEILAIKPDIIFHWDEAWFAFAHFHPLYYSRTAMSAVKNIRERLTNPDYIAFYSQWANEFENNTAPDKWLQKLFPNPNLVQLRVYVTQSTHKTLTAFRQASMIHIADVLFNKQRFLEAFRVHTSTSPNYQIIASLDIARRQAALEGFTLVRKSIYLAMQLRQRIQDSDLLKPYFKVLNDAELIPAPFHQHTKAHDSELNSLAQISEYWGSADFVIDPTRVTLDVSQSGIDGSGFRQLLINRYDIQINKTSRNTVLFLINIGATQATIDYLMQVLLEMAAKFEQEKKFKPQHLNLTHESTISIALPEKRFFHAVFLPLATGNYFACDIRDAYFKGAIDENVEYALLSTDTVNQVLTGRILVSASFVTPYPPGFPVIVPGQIITADILCFFQHIKVKEIHGFNFDLGFKIFRDDYLASLEIPLTF